MKRGIALGFFTSGAVLATAAILTTVERPSADPDSLSANPARIVSTRQNPADAPAQDRQRWAMDSLARPLFAPDRRPVAPLLQTGPGETNGLPRLSGIMITPSSRSAIFAPVAGGKPNVVTEGGRIGAYRVKSISDEQVVLTGPHGQQILHPTFDQMHSSGTVQPAAIQALVKGPAP